MVKKLSELYEESARHWEEQLLSRGFFSNEHISIKSCPFCYDTNGSCSCCKIDKIICDENNNHTLISLIFKLNKTKYNKELVILAGNILINIFKQKAKLHKSLEDMKECLKN